MTFLYPYFLLLLFVPIVLLFVRQLSKKYNSWAAICDAHLLPFLTIQTATKKEVFYKYLLLVLWCLATFCLAGPAVLKKDIPTAFIGNGIAVVVDMSPAMDKDATEQMMRKLYDLSTIENDTSLGLVLVDEKAYTALPMTQDKSILKNIIPSLKEQIMPSAGQNISAGIKKANELLDQSGFKNGQILLITAGTTDANNAINDIRASNHPVYVLGVGNEIQKHPVTLPNGQFWGGQKPFLIGLDSFSDVSGIQYSYATLDDGDLKKILNNASTDKIEKSDYSVEQYQNLGVYGVLLLLPLVALLFRRGVLFLLLIYLFASPCYAGFWWRTEQELYQKQMQAVADFNLGQYENAQKQFEELSSTDIEALYNLATTQAFAGNITQAIDTYKQVLAKNPNHADAAYNLEYLEKQLPPPQQEQQSQSSEQQNSDSNNEEKQNENQSDENKSNESQQSDKQNGNGNQNNNEQQSNASTDSNDDKDSEQKDGSQNKSGNQEDTSSNQEQSSDQSIEQNQQSMEQITQSTQSDQNEQNSQAIMLQEQKQKEWLDQIKPDAGRVLRYRLFKQYQEQQ